MRGKIRILKQPLRVAPHLQHVAKLADTHRQQLGFLPAGAYEELALAGRLWVATVAKNYAGHLIFGGTFPVIRIFQLFVNPDFRKRGIATELLSELVHYGERHGFLSIQASVAADLAANVFWERAGFYVAKQKAGGASRQRRINVRVRQLDTPTLFSLSRDQHRDASLPNLALENKPILRAPSFVLDLNVVFDIGERRPRYDSVSSVFQAAYNNVIRLRVSPEFHTELQRYQARASAGGILAVAESIPVLTEVSQSDLRALIDSLRPIVFPSRRLTRKRAAQDNSDLTHLAYCLHHRETGFITADRSILRAGAQLRSRFGIEVLSPIEVATDVTQERRFPESFRVIGRSEGELAVRSIQEADRRRIEQFLHATGVPDREFAEILRSGVSGRQRQRRCVDSNGGLLAVAAWEVPSAAQPQSEMFLLVNEQHPDAQLASDHLLAACMSDAGRGIVCVVDLVLPRDSAHSLRQASARGFQFVGASRSENWSLRLRKAVVGGVVTPEEWANVRQALSQRTGLRLPDTMPSENVRQIEVVTANAERVSLSWFDLETITGPVIYLQPTRATVIVPIQHEYSRELVGSSQTSFLPTRSALLRTEKAYYRAPQMSHVVQRGMPLIFYESARSGGAGAAVGCGRVTYTEVLSVDEVPERLASQGVLTRRALVKRAKDEKIHAFTFDNFQPFRNRVSIAAMRSAGAVGRKNLQTITSITGDRAATICQWGFAR